MKQWLQTETWNLLYLKETAHEKAELLHMTLLEKLDIFLPEKNLRIREDDSPWVNNEIKSLDRLQKRQYSKHKKSAKWFRLNNEYNEKVKKAKQDYSANIVNDLKSSNVSQWYSKIKRISSHAQDKDIMIVQELQEQDNNIQVERIADQFSEISQIYSPLKTEDINLDNLCDDRPLP